MPSACDIFDVASMRCNILMKHTLHLLLVYTLRCLPSTLICPSSDSNSGQFACRSHSLAQYTLGVFTKHTKIAKQKLILNFHLWHETYSWIKINNNREKLAKCREKIAAEFNEYRPIDLLITFARFLFKYWFWNFFPDFSTYFLCF